MTPVRRPSIASLIRTAGLAPTEDASGVAVEITGRAVVVRLETHKGGVMLSAALPIDAAAEAADGLLDVVLEEPGDTSATVEGGRVAVRRFLLAPAADELRWAVYRLAKSALSCQDEMRARAELATASNSVAIPADPAFPTTEPLAAALRTMLPLVGVPAPQPAWDAPDPSRAPRANLQPGINYTLLGRQGDWAQVTIERDVVVYTDGRTLRQAE